MCRSVPAFRSSWSGLCVGHGRKGFPHDTRRHKKLSAPFAGAGRAQESPICNNGGAGRFADTPRESPTLVPPDHAHTPRRRRRNARRSCQPRADAVRPRRGHRAHRPRSRPRSRDQRVRPRAARRGPAPDRRLRGAETPAPAAQFRARAHADRARRPGRPRHGARSRRRRLHHEAVPSFGAGSAGAGADTPRACERQIRPRPRPAAARHGGTAPVLRRAAARAVDAGDRRGRSSCSCARARSSPSSSSSITSTDGRAPRPATPWRWSSTRLRKKLEPSGVEIRTVRGMGYLIEKPRQNPPQ